MTCFCINAHCAHSLVRVGMSKHLCCGCAHVEAAFESALKFLCAHAGP
jgi:hypothetical protein